MVFEQLFADWLAGCVNKGIPDSVRAFSFNLYEPAGEPGVKFGIELIGAGQFDENDPDWPCDEVWAPEIRQISIPVQYSGDHWEACLQRLRALVAKQLDADSPAAQELKSSRGIGIGFVDGELEVIWKS